MIDKDVDDDASNGYQSAVIAGGLAYDSIYLDGSDTAIDQAADLGAGFKRFCAANLVEADSFGADMGFADRIYMVGEEEFSADGGSFFALDVNGRAIHEVVGFGKGTWESATSIDTGSSDTVAVLLFDDAKAPLTCGWAPRARLRMPASWSAMAWLPPRVRSTPSSPRCSPKPA